MEKQRLLDDLVWLYFRVIEWNITTNTVFLESIKKEAEELIREIYPYENDPRISMDHSKLHNYDIKAYYDSWKLRGDEPEWYCEGAFRFDREEQMESYLAMSEVYDFYKICRDYSVKKARNNKVACRLYYRYHYDAVARQRGIVAVSYRITPEYICVVDELQRCMRKKVGETGIVIECNPTSNLLIGPINEYSEHPIWKMDPGNLFGESAERRMNVTINTDDIGVFATSLENEYAVMLQSACRMRHEQGLEDDSVVYDYLDRIRENGLRASFGKR